MEADNQLKSQLRRLKLSGILDTLEMRLLESQHNQLDYKSFFSLLLQDEIEARQARNKPSKALTSRSHQASMRP